MGKERNKPLAERKDKPLRYYDREVCKYNLCGLCPNMLFTNTKSYLGECFCAVSAELCADFTFTKMIMQGACMSATLAGGSVPWLQGLASTRCMMSSWAGRRSRRSTMHCQSGRSRSK